MLNEIEEFIIPPLFCSSPVHNRFIKLAAFIKRLGETLIEMFDIVGKF